MAILSICILVKNEEVYLPRLLENLLMQGVLQREGGLGKSLSDDVQVIVGDTGSTDGTFEICKRYEHYNFRLVQILWENDFAKARNALHEEARGTWILSADADMTFSGFSSLIHQLKTVKEKIDGLSTVILDESTEHPKRFSAIRIFRRGVTMAGRVHETPVVAHGALCKLVIVHNRVETPEKKIEKTSRYTALLEEEIAENPENPYPYLYLIQQFFNQGNYAEVARILGKKPYWDSYDLAVMGSIQLTYGHVRSAGLAARSSLLFNPKDTRAMCVMADAMTATKQYGYAREWYAVACRETFDSVVESVGMVNYSEEEIVVAPRMGLASLYGEIGMLEDAATVLEEALKLYPHTAQKTTITRNLDKIRAGRKKSIILQ
jgi:glycosyltransferase involved in cell wall biosynthesis